MFRGFYLFNSAIKNWIAFFNGEISFFIIHKIWDAGRQSLDSFYSLDRQSIHNDTTYLAFKPVRSS